MQRTEEMKKEGGDKVTNSEKIIRSFSENYLYKELVYSKLKFNLQNGNNTEVEFADLIFYVENNLLYVVIYSHYSPPIPIQPSHYSELTMHIQEEYQQQEH